MREVGYIGIKYIQVPIEYRRDLSARGSASSHVTFRHPLRILLILPLSAIRSYSDRLEMEMRRDVNNVYQA